MAAASHTGVSWTGQERNFGATLQDASAKKGLRWPPSRQPRPKPSQPFTARAMKQGDMQRSSGSQFQVAPTLLVFQESEVQAPPDSMIDDSAARHPRVDGARITDSRASPRPNSTLGSTGRPEAVDRGQAVLMPTDPRRGPLILLTTCR